MINPEMDPSTVNVKVLVFLFHGAYSVSLSSCPIVYSIRKSQGKSYGSIQIWYPICLELCIRPYDLLCKLSEGKPPDLYSSGAYKTTSQQPAYLLFSLRITPSEAFTPSSLSTLFFWKMFKSVAVATALLAALGANAQSAVWGQCGGQSWTGATTCKHPHLLLSVAPSDYLLRNNS